MKQQQLPQVPPEWNWLDQAEQFFACLKRGQNPDDWTCDLCGRIDDHMGTPDGSSSAQYCAWCNQEPQP